MKNLNYRVFISNRDSTIRFFTGLLGLFFIAFYSMQADASLVAEWRMDEAAWGGISDEVQDSSGNSHHGTARNGATTTDGKVCRGGWFRGEGYNAPPNNQWYTAQHYLDVPHHNDLSPQASGNNAEMTISGWFRADSIGGTQTIVHKGGSNVEGQSSNHEYRVYLDGARLNFTLWNQSGGNQTLEINHNITSGDWYFFAFTMRRAGASNNVARSGYLYSDSQEAPLATISPGNINLPLGGLTTNRRLNIGTTNWGTSGDPNDYTNFFNGVIDELRIHSSQLDENEIRQLKNTSRICEDDSPLTCISDDFNRSTLGDDWVVMHSSGSFGDPRIVNNRFRLTDNTGNVATAATFQNMFPSADNLVTVEFDFYAYDGSGADGVAVVFSDAAVTPFPGGFGGSLGYANRGGIDGFAGGWLGIGLDTFGNFSNFNEGRRGGPGFRRNAIAVRGSGEGQSSGYAYITGTGSLNPTVRNSEGHRYRITIDSQTPGESILTIERNTGSGFVTEVGPIDVMRHDGQVEIPDNLLLTLTGSTGGSNDIHEIDNLEVCAIHMNPIDETVHHFRIIRDSLHGLSCNPMEVTILACLDSGCENEYHGPITASFLPSTGWGGGSTHSFESGASFFLDNPSGGEVTLGIANSSPAVQAFGQNRCYVGDSEQSNCDLIFHDAGFIFDVPNHTAAVSQDVTIQAVRQDQETELCVPGFANENKNVWFWFDYNNPSTGTLPIDINGNSIPQSAINTTNYRELSFDAQGQATFALSYPDVGKVQLYARHVGSGEDDGLIMDGSDGFVVMPDHFLIDIPGNSSATDASGPAFLSAGTDFPVTVSARNASGDITPNYGREAIPESVLLTSLLVAPVGGNLPDIDGEFGNFGEDCEGGSAPAGTACGLFNWPEVGIISLEPSVDDYLGAGNVVGTESGNVGRFYPDHFVIDHTITPACNDTFTYAGLDAPGNKAGQPFTVSGTITAHRLGGGITANYVDDFVKLNADDITASPRVDDDAAAGVLTGRVDERDLFYGVELDFFAGVDDFNVDAARYAFTAESAPQNMHLQITATDSDGVTGSQDDASTATEFRLGRLRIQNAHGSELIDLNVPMTVEYFNGTAFSKNTADICTTGLTVSLVSGSLEASDTCVMDSGSPGLSGVGCNVSGHIEKQFNMPPVVGGDFNLWLRAPGANNTGNIDVQVNTLPEWLRFDWNDDGTATGPEGRATFGIYEGSPRLIHIRERY